MKKAFSIFTLATILIGPLSPAAITAECGSSSIPKSLRWPVPSNRRVSQAFGVASSYMNCKFHTGIDIGAANGAAINAVANGKVVHVGHMWLSAPGTGRGPNAIIISHGNGTFSTYSHNSAAYVNPGSCVTAGETIAAAGALGYAPGGSHLHFEILTGTQFSGDWQTPFANVCPHYVNPMNYAYNGR